MSGQLDALPPFDPALVTTESCEVSDTDVVVGEEVTVSATVENANEQVASVDTTVEFGDATESVTVTVPAGGERGVSATFVPESPDTQFGPSISLTATEQ